MIPRQGRRLPLFVLSGVAVLCVAVADAQVLQPPERVFQRQPESRRLGEELTLQTDVLGGYDDSVRISGSGRMGGPRSYTGFAASRIRYRVIRERASLEAVGDGFANTISAIGTPSYGGGVTFGGQTGVGRYTEISLEQRVRSDPYFTLGAFESFQQTALDSVNGMFESSPVSAIGETRSLVLDTRASLRRRWTPRTTMEARYDFNDRTYQDGLAGDRRRHVGELSYTRSIGRSHGLESSYRYSGLETYDLEGNRLPTKDHSLLQGVGYRKNLSPTRRFEISGGAGVIYIESNDGLTAQSPAFLRPSAYGRASVDLGRYWALHANYRRRVSVLQGVVPQAFLTDSANVGMGGLIAGRLRSAFSASYSNGFDGGASNLTDVGRFHNFGVTGQVHVPVTRWSSAVVSYSHYRYSLDDVTSQALGLPPAMNRNVVYVGFTLQASVIGSPR